MSRLKKKTWSMRSVSSLGNRHLLEGRGGEEVADERQEERLVLVDQLGEVHVAQDAHDDHRLRVLGVGPFRRAQRPQHRQNVAQSEVVVHLQKLVPFLKKKNIQISHQDCVRFSSQRALVSAVFIKNRPISVDRFLLVLKTVGMKILLLGFNRIKFGVQQYLTRRIKEFSMKQNS